MYLINSQPILRWGPFVLASIVIIGVWASVSKTYGVFPLDDAYIHLAYAENLAETGTLSFNPGESSTGTSGPLWVALLAFFHLIGADLYWTALLLALFGFVILCLLVTELVRYIALQLHFTITEASIASLAAGLLLALNGNLIWFALSGMETLLFLCLSFLSIYIFLRRGFGVASGAMCGLAILTHPSGLLLPLMFLGVEVLRKNWLFGLRGTVAMVAVLVPYLVLTFNINGDLLPTTGRGKLITYVDGGFDPDRMAWFVKTFFVYQKFLPQHFLLLGASGVMVFVIIQRYRDNLRSFIQSLLSTHLAITVLVIWTLAQLALYTITFRSLFHHTRYLAPEYVIWVILGSVGLLFLNRATRRVPLGLFAGVASIAIAALSFPYWSQVYANDVKHVDEAYVRIGEWINENTEPDSKIAAFDIGVLRYIGDRYTIDLGGLTNTDAHPCLEKKQCGQFVRDQGADYILYSRNPDTEAITHIFLAEYEPSLLLKQTPVVQFETPQYDAPTLTHSYRMELSRIVGWFPLTTQGKLDAFSYDNRAFQSVQQMIDDRLEFVGYSIDQREIEKIPQYPFIVNFTYLFRAHKPLTDPYWVHMAFFDETTDRLSFYVKHIPTHNFLEPSRWPINQVVQESHVRWIPEDLPVQKFRVRLVVTTQPELDFENIEVYRWIDLGTFENKRNLVQPLNVPKAEGS